MKKTLVLAALGALAVAAPATAQTAFDGFYAGVGGGVEAQRNNASATLRAPGQPTLTALPRSGYSSTVGQAVVFGGYNMTFDRWVIGGEAAYRPGLESQRIRVPGVNFEIGNPSGTFSVVARAGYLVRPDLLLYGFAGWTGQQQEFKTRLNGNSFAGSRWANGLTAGVGAEYMLSTSVFLRAEFQYSRFNRLDQNFAGAGSSYQTRSESSRMGGIIGLGYRF